MSRLSVLLATLLMAVSLSVRAQSSEEQYVRIYNLIQQADALNGNGQFAQALPKYLEAQSALQRIQKFNPTWNPKVVSYRLSYIAERIEAGPGTAAATTVKKTSTPHVPAPTTTTSTTKPEAQQPPTAPVSGPNAADLQNTVARLQADKAILEAKLKEALATQPAAADPRELAKAQERIQSLLKENELLKTNLDTEKAKPGSPADAKQIEELKTSLSEANKKLTEQSTRATELLAEQQALQKRLDAAVGQSATEKTALQERINQLTASAAAAEALRAENAILKQQLAQSKTSVPSPDEPKRVATEAEARIATLQSDAQVLRLEKHALETRLTRSAAAASTNTANKELVAKVDQLTKEVTGLRAKVEVFEARAVPYTAEELALFQTENSKALAYTPDPKKKAARTLSAGSAALVAEAQRNFAAKDYTKAEQNYLDVLRQDEGNTTALANLATIQMEAGKLDAAEKNIQQALAAEPNDGYNLATLGKVKYQQEKYDEALDALSRAAKVVPQNAEIQNYLGVTLSQKGLRGPAETALRKAIQIDSSYGSAHNNLAVIYATQTPPLIELARWHYQKALAAGHAKNEELEKLFNKKESAAK